MENIFLRCVGLDVHKASVEACVRRMEPSGRLHQQTRHWGTMTRDILMMADWMAAQGVTHVAIAYASHCTSLGRCETFSINFSLFDNLTPLAFRGGLAPGSS
jgi:hypothetical protein